MKVVRGFFGLIYDLVNCFIPIDMPTIERPYNDGTDF